LVVVYDENGFRAYEIQIWIEMVIRNGVTYAATFNQYGIGKMERMEP